MVGNLDCFFFLFSFLALLDPVVFSINFSGCSCSEEGKGGNDCGGEYLRVTFEFPVGVLGSFQFFCPPNKQLVKPREQDNLSLRTYIKVRS